MANKTFIIYYEEIKRELNRRLTYECRCDEHLKIETRLRGERFESVKGECVI